MRQTDPLASFRECAERFRCADVVAVSGLTRQAVLKHLRRAIILGELVRSGEGRGTWYECATSEHPERATRLHDQQFWHELEKRNPTIKYINVVHAIGFHCRHARQAARLLQHAWSEFIVLDFGGVFSISMRFAMGLADQFRRSGSYLELINLSPRSERGSSTPGESASHSSDSSNSRGRSRREPARLRPGIEECEKDCAATKAGAASGPRRRASTPVQGTEPLVRGTPCRP
jgi:hypothetical protein